MNESAEPGSRSRTGLSTANWLGTQDRELWNERLVAAVDAVIDAARDGAWDSMLAQLTDPDRARPRDLVNAWRIGGRAWYTPIHHAAWHGAPVEVIHALLAAGSWTALRASDGRRPVDIALDRGHEHLVALLTPTFARSGGLPGHDVRRINRRLSELILRVSDDYDSLRKRHFRHVDVTVLLEDAGPDRIHVPVPGMYGGLSLQMHDGTLRAGSWSRIIGGSEMTHEVTPSETTSWHD